MNTFQVMRTQQELQLELEILAQAKIVSGEGKVMAGMLQMKIESELKQLQGINQGRVDTAEETDSGEDSGSEE